MSHKYLKLTSLTVRIVFIPPPSIMGGDEESDAGAPLSADGVSTGGGVNPNSACTCASADAYAFA